MPYRRVATSAAQKALNPFSKGRLNQVSGARFEGAIRYMGMRDGLLVVHNGLRARRYADKVVAEKSNIDFILLGKAERHEVAFIDAKAFMAKRFGRSMIDARQLALCAQYASRSFVAGFIVYLKELNHVGFYAADLLSSGGPRKGFGPEDSVTLGTLENFFLRRLWERCPPLQR